MRDDLGKYDREDIPHNDWAVTRFESGEFVDNGLSEALQDTQGNPDCEYTA